MTFKDTFALVGSKLKIRKTRTVITIITASALFGIIITVLLVSRGFLSSLLEHSQSTFDGRVMMVIQHEWEQAHRDPKLMEKATELYEASTDPDKQPPVITSVTDPDGNVVPPYLDTDNPFAIAAIAYVEPERSQEAKDAIDELVVPYQGRSVAIRRMYYTDGFPLIEQMTPPWWIRALEENGGFSCGTCPAGTAYFVDGNDILTPLIQIMERKDDVIQVIVPINRAAQALGIKVPELFNRNAVAMRSYISEVNQQAIGRRFVGTITKADEQGEERVIGVTYEIVGLLPAEAPQELSDPSLKGMINHLNRNVFETFTDSLMFIRANGEDYAYPFLVANPDTDIFRLAYRSNDSIFARDVIVAFDDVVMAETFRDENEWVIAPDFLNNRLDVYGMSDSVDRMIATLVAVFALVAVIIMAGTVGRVIDDERQTIALYRAVGASTGHIIQVFFIYILTLSFLIIISSTVIGLVFSGIITITNSAIVTANISLIYNLPDLAPVIFVGFDLRIFLIYLAIIVVGCVCLLLTIRKLVAKNIVKDLRK